MRGAFLIDERRVDSLGDACRLVLDGLVHDGVQPMIRHDFEHTGHQRVACFEIRVVRVGVGGALPALLGPADDLREVR
jgi:hypothetical protein